MIQSVTSKEVATAAPTPTAPTETPAVAIAPEQSAAAAPALEPKTEATPGQEAKTNTVATDLDAASVKQWAQLQKANRETKAQLAQLQKERDELKAKAETPAQPLKIASLKDAQAAGIDEAALLTLFADWMESEQQAATPLPKELTEIQAKLAKLEADKAEEEKQRNASKQAATKAEAEKAEKAVTSDLQELVKADSASQAPKWPRVAKEPDAIEDAKQIVIHMAKAVKRPVTDEEATKFFSAAFDQLEGHYKELAKRYSIEETPPQSPVGRGTFRVSDPVAKNRTLTIDNNRGSLRKPTQAESYYKTFKEVQAEIKAKHKSQT